jgi:NAD(P)-dependent dehydrogenase (short-subunit alcohol dehydrogenase family)
VPAEPKVPPPSGADPAKFDALAEAIAADHDRLDAVIYQSAGPSPSVASAIEIDADNERPFIDQLLLGPLHAIHRLAAPMLERGTGTLLVTVGSSALGPNPIMSQYGIPQAGLRNHVLTLAEAAKPLGVRVGLLVIGGLILGSDIHHNWVPDAGPDFPGALDADELATEFGPLIDGTAGPERIIDPFRTSGEP